MCGNGVRVFVHYLRVQGVVDVPVGGSLAVATRGGVKTVVFDGPSYTVDMGPYELPEGQSASIRVDVPGVGVRDGVRVDMPNPHAVVLLADERELQAARLTEQPVYDPAPADGINLELVGPGSPAPMRVLERGVGETSPAGRNLRRRARRAPGGRTRRRHRRPQLARRPARRQDSGGTGLPDGARRPRRRIRPSWGSPDTRSDAGRGRRPARRARPGGPAPDDPPTAGRAPCPAQPRRLTDRTR